MRPGRPDQSSASARSAAAATGEQDVRHGALSPCGSELAGDPLLVDAAAVAVEQGHLVHAGGDGDGLLASASWPALPSARARSASSSSATRRSSGVVTLRFSGAGRVDQDLAARLLDEHRVVGGGGDALPARCRGPREGPPCGRPGGSARPRGRRGSRSRPRRGRSRTAAGRGSRARLTVSVSGAAAITRGGVGAVEKLGDQLVDQLGGDQRPGRVVDGDQLGLDSPKPAATDCGAAARRRRPPRPPRAQLTSWPGGSGHDHGPDALGLRRRPSSDHSSSAPPAERYEGLRAAGSERSPGAGGRNDR